MNMPRHYPFTLQPLPYAYDSLAPVLDARTLEFHHDKHLQTYVDNLNATLKDAPAYHDWSLEKLIMHIDSLPENLRTPVRNNAGGVYNHELYFTAMTGEANQPGTAMQRGLEKAFGSFEEWKTQMKQAALTQFGSGWAWLIADAEDGLHIVKTPNQDTPLRARVRPLLLVDVWEHAYYLQYQNRRAEYLDLWFSLIDWRAAEARMNSREVLASV